MKILPKYLIIFILLFPPTVVWFTNFGNANMAVQRHLPPTGDQAAIYENFSGVFNGKGEIPGGIQNGWMPIGYLALIGFYHKSSVLWSTPDVYSSFIYHSLVYATLTALITIVLMFQVAIDQSPNSNRVLIALGCAVFWFAVFRLSAIMRFAWLPWSHHASAFAGITFVACFYQMLTKKNMLWFFLTAFFASVFFYSRRHEAFAVFLGSGLVGVLYLSTQFSHNKLHINLRNLLQNSLGLFMGFLFAHAFIAYFSNYMPFNAHYAQLRLLDSYVNEYMKIYPQTLPVRIIQTFFDPNFYSYGNLYHVRAIVNKTFGYGQFAMPMIFQLPILWFLLPMAFGTLVFVGMKQNPLKKLMQPAIILFLIGFASFLILSLGYMSTALWSGVHLKNGLVREFILSGLLLMVSTGPALYLLFADYFKQRMLAWFIPLSGILFFSVLWGQVVLSHHSYLLEFLSTHIDVAKNKNHYFCQQGKCDVELTSVFENGKIVHPPFDYAIIQFGCPIMRDGKVIGMSESGITKRGRRFDFNLVACPYPVTVQVFSLFEGYASSGQLPGLVFTV